MSHLTQSSGSYVGNSATFKDILGLSNKRTKNDKEEDSAIVWYLLHC